MKIKLLILSIVVGILVACPSDHRNNTVILKIAVEKNYLSYFKTVTDDFIQEHPNLKFEIIEGNMFDILNSIPIQKGNSADIFMLVGTSRLAEQKLIAPLSFIPTGYRDVAIETGMYNNYLYYLPMSAETTFLIYNKDLVSQAPTFLSQLDPKDWAVKYTDLYYAAGLIYGQGGYIFGEDDLDLGFTSSGSKKAGAIIQSLYTSGATHWSLMKDDTIAYDVMMDAFYNEEIAYIINGPWVLADIIRNGINFGIAPIPSWDGSHFYQPFSGIRGLSINAYSKNHDIAQEFLQFLAQEKYAQLWFEMTNEVSAHKSVIYPEHSPQYIIAKALHHSIPMANTLALDKVWVPMADALKQIANGQDVSQALENAQDIIKSEIENI